MARPMLDRILREIGGEALLEGLAEGLPPTDLQSLLLEVFARRGAARDASDVARQFAESRFTRPSVVPQRAQLDFDRLAYSVLPDGFEGVELSPLAPLGVCSALAAIHPDKAVATVRNVEVGSDPTNVLALIAAARRRAEPARARGAVRLCTSHRAVRPEQFDVPNAWAHFRLFALVTAGRAGGDLGFELAALREHAGFHVRLLARARERGHRVRSIRLALAGFDGDEARDRRLLEEVAEPLRAEHPDLQARLDPGRTRGRGYYRAAGFQVDALGDDGETYFLGDGGLTDWTARLLGDRKERLMISGFGSERFCACLAPSGASERR